MSELPPRTVQIKGIKEGLLISLNDGPWDEIKESLFQQIQQQASFYQGAKVALDVGSSVLKAAELGSLRDKLSDLGISLWAVISSSQTTEDTAQVLGMATRISNQKNERNDLSAHNSKPKDTSLPGEEAVFVQRTLRSGFSIHSEGHAVVVGDINPGAEIVCGGSVVVWGKARGSIQAGLNGYPGAVVCAMELAPTHLRIGEVDAPVHVKKGKSHPEIAFIQNGQIIFESWKTKE